MKKKLTTRGALLLLSVMVLAVTIRQEKVNADEGHHLGTFVGIRGTRIAILSPERTVTYVYPLAEFVRVNRNGMEGNVGALRRGDRVQVTTETRFRTEYVIVIVASSQ